MGVAPRKPSRVMAILAEIFVWTLLAAFVEVLVTCTVERLSLGSKYVMAADPFWSLQGHTTMWDVVDAVGLTFGLRVLVKRFETTRTLLRKRWVQGFAVMFLIYFLEFFGGLFFNKLLHFHLWDYSQYEWHGVPLNLMGQITLVYAPFWFTAGLLIRPVYRAVHGIAPDVGGSMEEFFQEIEPG